jgi:hypothetical protein
MPIRHAVNRVAYRLSKVVRPLLKNIAQRLDAEQRQELAVQLVEAAFESDFNQSFLTIEKVLTKQRLHIGLRERLLSRACSDLDPTNLPDALLEQFSGISGASLHYSQDGEDIVLNRLFGGRAEGFYVDIGAHHATRFSNTFSLYRRGWHGINVDATPGSMATFRGLRPRDISLELFISDRIEPLCMHLFREAALNTASATLAKSYVAAGWEKTGEIELLPKSLAGVMGEHVPASTTVDLLSIDVEGEELGVLRSGDWDAYRPVVVVIEALATSLARLQDEPAVRFLTDRGYEARFRLFNSVVLTSGTTQV